jgi:hypothetical protein
VVVQWTRYEWCHAYDRSGQGNDGTLTNGPVPDSGKAGQALRFDGVDSEVVVANDADLRVTTDYTVAGWINSAVGGVEQELYMYDNSFPAFSGAIIFGIDSDNKVALNAQNGTDNAKIVSSATVSTNTWTHIAGVHTNGQTTLYINGAASGGAQTQRDPVYNGPHSSTGLHIGYFNDGIFTAAAFNGLIDEVRLYNRALSAGEVLQLYNLSK